MNVFFFKFSTLLYLLGALGYSAYIVFLKESLSKSAITAVLDWICLSYPCSHRKICGSRSYPGHQSP